MHFNSELGGDKNKIDFINNLISGFTKQKLDISSQNGLIHECWDDDIITN